VKPQAAQMSVSADWADAPPGSMMTLKAKDKAAHDRFMLTPAPSATTG
jgi:hypothetical protein